MEKKTVALVVNPISGGKDKSKIIRDCLEVIRQSNKVVEIHETKRGGLGLAEFLTKQKYESVVAIGGDGTMNLIATSLVNKPIPLIIIPFGSGNGLATTLGLNSKISSFAARLDKPAIKVIDVLEVNGVVGVNLGGAGVDGQIASRFEESGKRGFANYLKIALPTLTNGAKKRFRVESAEFTMEFEAFQVSFANSRQYGNNFSLTPHASLTDGLLDLLITANCNQIGMFASILRQLAFKYRKPMTWPYDELKSGINVFQMKACKIWNLDGCMVHIDGELIGCPDFLDIKVIPNALQLGI